MMSKIDAIIRQRVESELEKERQQPENSKRASEPAADSVAPYDVAAYRENQPKMAVLVSKDFMNVDVIEGRESVLEFTVQN